MCEEYDYLTKIIIIGDSGVGKSSILRRFSSGNYDPNESCTIGVDFAVKQNIINDKFIKTRIWDCAGQERFRSIVTSYYRGSDGVMIVYSMNDRESFEHAKRWHEDCKLYAKTDMEIIIVASKCDMNEKRLISYEEGKTYADSIGAKFAEISAAKYINVDESFELLIEAIIGRMEKINKKDKNETVIIDIANKKKRKCLCFF